jgi:O-antigen ligase
VISLLLSGIFVFYINDILNNNVVTYVLQNYLNTDTSLTGRMQIYEEVEYFVAMKPLMGWGPTNAALVVADTIGYGNIQNGILQNIMTYGIVGLTFFFMIVVSISYYKYKFNKEVYPFYALLFTFILMGTIEVCLGSNFIYLVLYMAIAKLYLLNNQTSKKPYDKKKLSYSNTGI